MKWKLLTLELRAREQLEEIKRILKQTKDKVRSFKLPAIPKNYYVEMSEAMARLQGIMDFYVSQGNYTAQDHETMIENDSRIFTMEGIDTVMGNQ